MLKYDIVGRPVDGRSGGGLFTPSGQLIGVCNAAAVDFDEGIYSSLDTIYWQIEKVNLAHLFAPAERFASNEPLNQQLAGSGGAAENWGDSGGSSPKPWDEEMTNPALRDVASPISDDWTPPENPSRSSGLALAANGGLGAGSRANPVNHQPRARKNVGSERAQAQVRQHLADQRTDVSWARTPVLRNSQETEVIIIVRSLTNPNHAETITVSDPSPQLLNYLGKMKSEVSGRRDVNVASHRDSSLVPVRR